MKNRQKRKVDFCPICGKAEIPVDESKINYDVGGYSDKCPVCRGAIWYNAVLEKFESAAVPVFGIPAFELEEIISRNEIELFEQLMKEQKEREENGVKILYHLR
ncbi:MAG: hypothetical protein LiPW39_52 [Parcubacteria group bacterium LiPW_39]|nr:MAG: hypothetical protein LiPW39_52 [Parcubacteria group bacterium LiPW_39]